MTIQLNGEAMELAAATTVRALIEQLGLHTGPVAVEVNGAVVVRARHADTQLEDGDIVEIVHFVGGG